MSYAIDKLEQILRQGFPFEFGDYISRGFGIWKEKIGLFLGYSIVVLFIIIVTSIVPVIGPIVSNLLLVPALTVGGWIVAYKISRQEAVEFSDFFDGFKYSKDIFLAMLVMMVIIAIAMIPFFIFSPGLLEWYISLFTNSVTIVETVPPIKPISVLFLAPVLYFSIAYMWTTGFIVFYKMNFWPAMEMSRRFISKHWFLFLLFTFVTSLLGGIGVLLFIVGIFLTYPMYICIQYAAFEDATDLLAEEDGEIRVEDHLIV